MGRTLSTTHRLFFIGCCLARPTPMLQPLISRNGYLCALDYIQQFIETIDNPVGI